MPPGLLNTEPVEVLHGDGNELPYPNPGLPGAVEQDPLVVQGQPGDPQRRQDPGESNAGRALDVVIEAADPLLENRMDKLMGGALLLISQEHAAA